MHPTSFKASWMIMLWISAGISMKRIGFLGESWTAGIDVVSAIWGDESVQVVIFALC